MLDPDRYLSPYKGVRDVARDIFYQIEGVPIIDPHTHHSAKVILEDDSWGNPYDFFCRDDHYLWRLLGANGVSYEDLGVRYADGSRPENFDPRRAWQIFAIGLEGLALTPSYAWTMDMLARLGVEEPLGHNNAESIYDYLEEVLASDAWKPCNLLATENIHAMATTDGATDDYGAHQLFNQGKAEGRVIPTFRPDDVISGLGTASWLAKLERLGELTGQKITDLATFCEALRVRRQQFKNSGATASDHGLNQFTTGQLPDLSEREASDLFRSCLDGYHPIQEQQTLFSWYMLGANATMASEDGLTLQVHAGVKRNYDPSNYNTHGADCGFDFPINASKFASNLFPVLNHFGHSEAFKIVVYCLDPMAIMRDLAPMAGAYPALYLGMPWWEWDSPHGIRMFLENALPSAGWHKVGPFVSDTRSPTIGVRHDLFRRVLSGWLAEKVCANYITKAQAIRIAHCIVAETPSWVFGI